MNFPSFRFNKLKSYATKASGAIKIAFVCVGYTLLYLFLGLFGGKLENKKI